jgi:integrase
MKIRQSYSLYPRKQKSGKPVYYYRTYSQDGRRTAGRSTGQTTKIAARTYVESLIKKGKLQTKGEITFGKFAENWFVWDKCLYVKGRLARGTITRSYVDVERSYLQNHILPSFKDKRLSKIDHVMIEKWFLDLTQKKAGSETVLSTATANHCLTTLKIILKGAEEQGYYARSPAASIVKAKAATPERNLLSLEQYDQLFQGDALKSRWNSDLCMYALNLLAATTGMRMGELQALQLQNVHENSLTIEHSWDRKYGLKSTKTNRPRIAMLFSQAESTLKEVLSKREVSDPGDFVFFGKARKTPVYYKTISEAFYKALDNIGIGSEERKKRRLTFHSWRHFFNTNMRMLIPDEQLRLLTGHQTEEMSDRYTQLSPTHFATVQKTLEEVFGEEGAKKRGTQA